MRQITTLVVTAASLLIAAAPARAERPRVNVQLFRPAGHPGDLLATRSASVPTHLAWSVGVLANYAKLPLVFEDPWLVDKSRGTRDEVVSDQLTLDLSATFALFDWIDLGVALPLFPINTGQTGGYTGYGDVDGFVIGDLRIAPKVRIIGRGPSQSGFGLAIELLTGLPTGDAEAFVSDGFTFQPTLLADFRIPGLPVTIALNAGFLWRSEARLLYEGLDLGPGMNVSGGVRWEVLPEQLSVAGEAFAAIGSFDAEPGTKSVEGIASVRYVLRDVGLAFTLGGGSGFTSGVGSTAYRVVAGIGYATGTGADADGDGIAGSADQCPDEAEDEDGFEDTDGCPDLDNDNDGIPDVGDDCPEDPEDVDGFKDQDGCSDPDNDDDGVPDVDDKCPGSPEDPDGFQDEDGCPDPDNDGDKVPDASDKCPDHSENFNGYEDDDGCPDDRLARIDKDKIETAEKIRFVKGNARIRSLSNDVIAAVANILKLYPDIKKIRIEGHTDSRGAARINLRISQARADAIEERLVEAGIDADRMVAVGYGEEIPAAVGNTKEAYEANQRIEFVILER